MTKPIYPLEQVLSIKKDRVEKAEKVVTEKKRALQIELDKLKTVEEERDVVRNHHQDKLTQLRAALDEGTTSDEVLQMKAYLKVVKAKLLKAEEKVKQQKEQVRNAEKQLEEARKDLQMKRLEEEKITLHKQEWEKETNREIAKKEAIDQDEIGQVLYESHRKNKEN